MPEVTKHAPGTPSWFELSTTDEKGALEFYGALFGWVDEPQPMGENVFYHMQKLNGLEAAAIYQQQEEERNQGVPGTWFDNPGSRLDCRTTYLVQPSRLKRLRPAGQP